MTCRVTADLRCGRRFRQFSNLTEELTATYERITLLKRALFTASFFQFSLLLTEIWLSYEDGILLHVPWLKTLSTSSRTLQTLTQQETVTPCLLFLSQRISAHVFTANHITHLPTATLSTDQSHRSPGFLNFQLTNTTTWLWRWLPHKLSKRQSLTTVLLRTPTTQKTFFNQGMLFLGSNHFLNYFM